MEKSPRTEIMENGLVYEPAGHNYYLNGRPLPSVSEIVGLMNGNTYAGIPRDILDNAAKFGSAVHKDIELYNLTRIVRNNKEFNRTFCLSQWVKLSGEFDQIIENELIVHYMDLFAGTFDALAIKNGELILLDYKTTNKFHRENVTLQLNLYRIAYEWKTGKKIKRLAAVWLPKHRPGKIEFVDILDDYELLQEVKTALEKGGNIA